MIYWRTDAWITLLTIFYGSVFYKSSTCRFRFVVSPVQLSKCGESISVKLGYRLMSHFVSSCHILASSLIYNCAGELQHGIYLLIITRKLLCLFIKRDFLRTHIRAKH